jgi:ArsR family transcriptional regulator, arsenate/arsenite/antimonite-responsive transcriptional repressor
VILRSSRSAELPPAGYCDYAGKMETKLAVAALSALAHEGRLATFRMLVQTGREGIAAGEIARRLGVPANTLSSNLNILSHAGLIDSRRDGRSIIYSARYEHMTELLEFLMQDCCAGSPEICAHLVSVTERSRCEAEEQA